jgi:hypothetical protein
LHHGGRNTPDSFRSPPFQKSRQACEGPSPGSAFEKKGREMKRRKEGGFRKDRSKYLYGIYINT